MPIDTGGYAYPCHLAFRAGDGQPFTAGQFFEGDGQTLLDHFAGLAMQGILADPEDWEKLPGLNCPQSVARYAYDQAEEMIKEKRRRERMQ